VTVSYLTRSRRQVDGIQETCLILEPVSLVLSTFTKYPFPLDIRLLLGDSLGPDTLGLWVDFVEVRDVHGVYNIRGQEVPSRIKGDEQYAPSLLDRVKLTYLTVPMLLMVSIGSLSAAVDTRTKTSSFFSLMAVLRPPIGKTPIRTKGTEKMVK
jgi:hypothetical protein